MLPLNVTRRYGCAAEISATCTNRFSRPSRRRAGAATTSARGAATTAAVLVLRTFFAIVAFVALVVRWPVTHRDFKLGAFDVDDVMFIMFVMFVSCGMVVVFVLFTIAIIGHGASPLWKPWQRAG